jgi:DNA-directed RNA polymerase subunit RPC12/RpoP
MPATITSPEWTALVTTIHFCRWCGRHTRHELRGRNIVCLDCTDYVLLRELDRD